MNDDRNYSIIAIDFDGTLFETDYPTIVSPNLGVIDAAKWCKECGDKLILWTCREGPELDAAIQACREYGLEFDAVNDNLPELKEKWGNNPRKVSADDYWDDKNSDIHYFIYAQAVRDRLEAVKNIHVSRSGREGENRGGRTGKGTKKKNGGRK